MTKAELVSKLAESSAFDRHLRSGKQHDIDLPNDSFLPPARALQPFLEERIAQLRLVVAHGN